MSALTLPPLNWRDWFSYSFENPWFFTHFGFWLVFGFFLLGYAFLRPSSAFRKLYVICFSLFFYYKSSGPLLLIFLSLIVGDYLFAQWIEKIQNQTRRKFMLILSLLISLSWLLYFKYTVLIVQTINDLGAGNYSIPDIFLPIGISFYTFQSISYIVDVYSKKIPSSRNFIDYAFYMTFFPHLVAGPIVRAKDFIPQINHPIPFGNEQIRRGFFRILTGLSKKLILADFLARYVDMLHSDPAAYNGAENLLGMVAYSCQIYFDFSGYSDIAIGIAILLGYELKENFNNPYQATSITEFWRRWHISLSTWLRDYIYIPLGGNQKGKYNQYLFLMITMTIGGLWHGANWKFVLWGICHGAALILHKLILRDKEISPDRMNWLSRLLKTIAVFLFVSVLWIFFRAVSFDHALQSLSKIIHNQHWIDYINFWEQREEVILVLTISLLLIFIPVKVKQYLQILFDRIPFWLLFPLLLLGMQLILELKGTEIKPFIYFQF